MWRTCLLLFACGSTSATLPTLPAGSPTRVATTDEALLVGGVAEGTLNGGPADTAHLVFTATAPKLAWMLHSHLDSGTQTIENETDTSAVDFIFVPPEAGDWYVTLRNQDTAPMTVHVELSLYGGMQWTGFE